MVLEEMGLGGWCASLHGCCPMVINVVRGVGLFE